MRAKFLVILAAVLCVGGCSGMYMTREGTMEDDGERHETLSATWKTGAHEPVKQPSYYDPNVPPPADAGPQQSK